MLFQSTVATARRDSEFNSADYYLNQEVATGFGNTQVETEEVSLKKLDLIVYFCYLLHDFNLLIKTFKLLV